MVGPVGLLHDLEAHVARVLAAVVTELLDGGEAVLLARRNDVDVRHHVDGVAGGTGPEGADRDADVHALVDRGVADRLDLLAELRGVRRLPVRLERLLVLPDLQDHELVRLADAAHHLGPQISVLLAGRLPVALEQRDAVRPGPGHYLDVGHGADMALHRRFGPCFGRGGPGRADQHHRQPEDKSLHHPEPPSARWLSERERSMAASVAHGVSPGRRPCRSTTNPSPSPPDADLTGAARPALRLRAAQS